MTNLLIVEAKNIKNTTMIRDKKNLKEHIYELRLRLLICLISIIIAVFISMYYSQGIYMFFLKPLERAWSDGTECKFIFTSVTEGFLVQLKIAFVTGIFISSPIFLSQIYFFIAPGLYKKEKFAILPFILIAPLLFCAGLLFSYYFIIPRVLKFFLSFEQKEIDFVQNNIVPHAQIVLEAKISEYLDIFLDLSIGFAMTFQLPLIILLLIKIGLVDYVKLVKFRKYAIILIFIISAILTPPDMLSQILLAIPMILLYECSLLIYRLCYKNHK